MTGAPARMATQESAKPPKKPYRTPVLIVYGKIHEITRVLMHHSMP